MSGDVLTVLRSEERRLLAELEKTPLFQKLDAVRRTMALYTSQEEATDRAAKAPAPRTGTTSSAVLDGAEEYLRQTGRREMAPGITKELHTRGIVPGTDVQTVRTVASYLSSAKDRFNNVRGQGYGLAEWPATQASDEPEQSTERRVRIALTEADFNKGEMHA